MVIYTVYTAFENRKISLNRACADKHIPFFANVGLPRMANRAVTAEVLAQPTIARMIVRHYVGIPRDIFFYYLPEQSCPSPFPDEKSAPYRPAQRKYDS